MVQLKFITLKCGELNLDLTSTTEVKITEEIDSDLIKTFDDPVPVPSSEAGYSVSVSILEARTLEDFITLRRILKRMKKKEGEITVSETHERKGDETDIKQENFFSGCLLSSNEVTFNAEDLTARSLEFKAKKVTEVVNGETIE